MRAHGFLYLSCLRWIHVFGHRVTARLGFDEHRANRLVIQDDHRRAVLGATAKRDALNDLRAELAAADTLARGDEPTIAQCLAPPVSVLLTTLNRA